MATKLSVAIVSLAMIMTPIAAASVPNIPAGGLGWVGPRPLDICDVPQALGYGGNAAGSAGGSGANGYHSYANDPSGIILDSCLSGTDVAAWPGCASAEAQADIIAGLAQIQAGLLALDVDQIQEGVNTITVDASNFYQNECGGLLGTGTDGEFEYGTLAAALNVREGPGAGNNGDGTDSCIGPRSTAHHGDDTTVFVTDLVLKAPEFHVSGDWARTSGQSDDNTNLNSRDDRPEISHCGDGAIEPCHGQHVHPGYVNQLVTYGGPVGLASDVVDTAGHVTALELVGALDTVFGCNPLDCNVDIPAGHGSWDSGGPLSDFCGGAAAGWLLVTVGTEVIPETLTLPTGTVGWIWTGTGAANTFTSLPACGSHIAGPAGTTITCRARCAGAVGVVSSWFHGPGKVRTTATGANPCVGGPISATADSTMPVGVSAGTMIGVGFFTCKIEIVGGWAAGHGVCGDP